MTLSGCEKLRALHFARVNFGRAFGYGQCFENEKRAAPCPPTSGLEMARAPLLMRLFRGSHFTGR
jgi:hypothetical protein